MQQIVNIACLETIFRILYFTAHSGLDLIRTSNIFIIFQSTIRNLSHILVLSVLLLNLVEVTRRRFRSFVGDIQPTHEAPLANI